MHGGWRIRRYTGALPARRHGLRDGPARPGPPPPARALMDVRQYLALLRRQRWVVVAAVAVVVASTLAFYEVRPAEYRATAMVLITPLDPSERFFNPPGQAPEPINVEAEASFVRSFDVARKAAATLPGSTPQALLRQVSYVADPETGLVGIQATDSEPARARNMASAFARAFVDNRREAAAAARRRVVDQLGGRLKELQERIADLDRRIGDGGLKVGPEGVAGASVATPPGSLQAERYAAALQYRQIFERQQLLAIEQGLDTGTAEHVAEAPIPFRALGPGPVRAGAVAAFVGLLLGIGLALLREYLSDRLQSRDEVERAAGLPVLGEIPRDRAQRRRPGQVACADRPLSATAESVRTLRTNLQNLRPDRPLRRLVVTSPNARDGKTFVSVNLATAYAQAGYRTVLVSSDLRRPALTALFGPTGQGTGLSSLLSAPELRPPAPAPAPERAVDEVQALAANDPRRRRNLLVGRPAPPPPGGPGRRPVRAPRVADFLLRTSVAKLHVLPAGPLPPNPAELLGSARMGEVLDELGTLCDVVILDTPPLLAVSDAAILAAGADGVVLVTAMGQTPRHALRTAQGLLAVPNVEVLGMVINKADGGARSAYHGYYDERSAPAAAASLVPLDERSRRGTAGTRLSSAVTGLARLVPRRVEKVDRPDVF